MLSINVLSGFGGGGGAGFTFDDVVSSNTADYNLRARAVAAGWNQTEALIATVTVNSGVTLYASTTSNYGFDTGSSFPTGSVLKLNLLGTGKKVVGCGGSGTGGPALRAQHAITITNGGTIGGGGGGGGNGESGVAGVWDGESSYVSFGSVSGGPGGTGEGLNAATGGGSGSRIDFTYGSNSYSATGGGGGVGGALGSAGGSGSSATGDLFDNHGNGDAGGGSPGGAAVVGNSFITWAATGARLGSIS